MRKVDDVHACVFVLLAALLAVPVTHFPFRVEKLVSIDLIVCQFSFVVDMIEMRPFGDKAISLTLFR